MITLIEKYSNIFMIVSLPKKERKKILIDKIDRRDALKR